MEAVYTLRQGVVCVRWEKALDRTHVRCGACGAREDRDEAAVANLVLKLMAKLCASGEIRGVVDP